MYGKLFSAMYEGSLYGDWKALITFQQLVILANQDGVVDMTPQAIAARTSIPLDIIVEGLEALERPDPYSRTPDREGRRIERLDDHRPWGWSIVNYLRYVRMVRAEDKRAADRERMAAKRATTDGARQEVTLRDRCREVAIRRRPSHGLADVAHIDADADVDADALNDECSSSLRSSEHLSTSLREAGRFPACPIEEIVISYRRRLPTLRQPRRLNERQVRLIESRWRQAYEFGMFETPEQGVAWFDRFFAGVAESPFLTGCIESTDANRAPFRADLNWLMKPEKFVHVVEGRYGMACPHGGE